MHIDKSRNIVALIGSLLLAALSCGEGAGGTPMPLADHVAGQACFKDEECPHGECLKTLPSIVHADTALTALGGYCSRECTLDADCGADGVCLNTASAKGQCMARCASASHCRAGYQCLDSTGQRLDGISSAPRATAAGSCQVLPTASKLTGDVVGRMCTADTDCGAGFCSTVDLVFRSYPGGYCSGNCMNDSDCGDVGTCAKPVPGAFGNCFRTCTTDADCGRSDYRCRRNVTGAGMQCQPAVQPLPDATSGKACTSDAACGGAANSCATQSMGPNPISYPGGYCTQACVDSKDCGAGGVCVLNFAIIAMGSCYQSCSSAKDCRAGYECAPPVQPAREGTASSMHATGPLVCTPAMSQATDLDAGASD